MSVRIDDNLPQFTRSLYSVMDDAIKEGARDTLRNARTRAPFKAGQLRSDSDIHKQGRLLWRISFWKEYARFQEFGGDGKRRVRNYSTSGTGKRYLQTSGDEQAMRIRAVFKKHAMRARP